MFGLLKCDCYIGDIVIPWIVKSGFCSVHFIVILAGLKNVKRYIGNIVIAKIVILGFHCMCKNMKEINILTTAAKLRVCLIFSESRS